MKDYVNHEIHQILWNNFSQITEFHIIIRHFESIFINIIHPTFECQNNQTNLVCHYLKQSPLDEDFIKFSSICSSGKITFWRQLKFHTNCFPSFIETVHNSIIIHSFAGRFSSEQTGNHKFCEGYFGKLTL